MEDRENALKYELRNFLDERGRLMLFPSKHRLKKLACAYLAGKLEAGKSYTEREINDLLDEWTTFHDPATLRREMYDAMLLEREKDGSRYWIGDGALESYMN